MKIAEHPLFVIKSTLLNTMQTADELKEIGAGLLDLSKVKESVEYFTRAIKLDSSDAEAWCLRGVAWFQLLEIEQAKSDMYAAISANPEYHLAYFYIAEIALHQSDLPKAKEYYEKALDKEPDNYSYLTGFADALNQLKEYDNAITACGRILSRYPADSLTLQLCANAYSGLGRYDKAIACYELVIQAGQAGSMVYNNAGYFYSKTGETEKSREYLETAIRLDPGFAYPYDNLGYVYMLKGDFDKAHELINKSLELDPANAYAYKNRALVYLAQHETGKAVAALRKAKDLRFDLLWGDEVDKLLEQLQNH